jgi:hypothetical protein
MLLLFWVPFVIAAALVFTILSLIPRERRWAIPAATGILCAEPCLMVALVGAPFVLKFLGLRRLNPTELFYLGILFAAIGGIAGGLLAGLLARYIVQLLPKLFLRIAVVLAGWCSYFVVIYTLNFVVDRDFTENLAVFSTVAALESVLALIAAWLIAKDSERFRGRRIRLQYGMPFRKRGPSPPAPSVP